MNKTKNAKNKGITLIALIITIIVMLILVTVSITMAVKGGLFNYAKDAATQTNTKMEEENKLATGIVNVEGKGEMDINAIVKEYTKTKKLIHFTIHGWWDDMMHDLMCTAVEGMTWEEWYESEYSDNIDGLDKDLMEFYEVEDIEDPDYGEFYLYINGCGVSIDEAVYDTIDTEIVDGATYCLI